MAEQRTGYVPTLWGFKEEVERIGGDEPGNQAAYDAFQKNHIRSFQHALSAGVIIAAGTDSMYPIPPADCLVSEIEHLAKYGMTPSQALIAATMGGAIIMGKDKEIGKIAPGYDADIIALDGNPLEDLNRLRHVDFVIKKGQVFFMNLPVG